jgi:hypothetical protein
MNSATEAKGRAFGYDKKNLKISGDKNNPLGIDMTKPFEQIVAELKNKN